MKQDDRSKEQISFDNALKSYKDYHEMKPKGSETAPNSMEEKIESDLYDDLSQAWQALTAHEKTATAGSGAFRGHTRLIRRLETDRLKEHPDVLHPLMRTLDLTDKESSSTTEVTGHHQDFFDPHKLDELDQQFARTPFRRLHRPAGEAQPVSPSTLDRKSKKQMEREVKEAVAAHEETVGPRPSYVRLGLGPEPAPRS